MKLFVPGHTVSNHGKPQGAEFSVKETDELIRIFSSSIKNA
jgi:hypothetical protein